MEKISLASTLESAYESGKDYLKEVKSAMLGLCSDIERYFRIACYTSLNSEIDMESYKSMVNLLPRFKALTREQLNRFILLFINIRSVNAHLYLAKPVFLDEDLKQFIEENCNPTYPIEIEKRLTLYGSVLVLALLAKKFMIWPFCITFFKDKFFEEITGSGRVKVAFQMEQLEKLQSFCGKGGQLNQKARPIHNIDFIYINNLIKRRLTVIFFDLEKIFSKDNSCGYKTLSLITLLKKNSLFNDELISKIKLLRNCWTHGYFIGDILKNDGEDFEFTLEFIIETLKELVDVAKENPKDFALIIQDTAAFAQSMYDHYFLRMIEVSYKVLDVRLLIENKLEDRLNVLKRTLEKVLMANTNIFALLVPLFGDNGMNWFLTASKFSDICMRSFTCKNLKIVKIHSESGFVIGKFKTEMKDIVVAIPFLEKEYRNLINGIDIWNINGTTNQEISKYITLMDIEL